MSSQEETCLSVTNIGDQAKNEQIMKSETSNSTPARQSIVDHSAVAGNKIVQGMGGLTITMKTFSSCQLTSTQGTTLDSFIVFHVNDNLLILLNLYYSLKSCKLVLLGGFTAAVTGGDMCYKLDF